MKSILHGAAIMVSLVVLSGALSGCRGSFGGKHGATELPSGVVTKSGPASVGSGYELCVVADADAAVRDFTTGKEYCLGGRSEGEAEHCKVNTYYPECTHAGYSPPPESPSSLPSKKK